MLCNIYNYIELNMKRVSNNFCIVVSIECKFELSQLAGGLRTAVVTSPALRGASLMDPLLSNKR